MQAHGNVAGFGNLHIVEHIRASKARADVAMTAYIRSEFIDSERLWIVRFLTGSRECLE